MGFLGGFFSRGDRDKSLDILPYGVIFDVQIQPLNDNAGDPIPPDNNAWQTVTQIFIYGKSEKNKLLSIQLGNLPLKRWYLRFVPHVTSPSVDTSNTIRIDNTGVFQISNSSVSVKPDLSPITITCERNGSGINQDFIDDTIRENFDKRTASSERGAPVSIVSVSEGIDPAVVGADMSYEGIAMAGVRIKASDRINSNPDLQLFITEGREIRNHLFYGESETNGLTMTDTAQDFLLNSDLNAGASIIRNLETGEQDLITGVTNNNIVNNTVNFSVGDRYLIFNIQSSSYFPDIYVDMLINPEGGLGSLIDGDEYIDYESICEANDFVKANGFFWDGVLEAPEEFSTWAAEQASFSRLLPLRVEGRYGLIIEDVGLPLRAVFNESNIIKDSYMEETVAWQENDINQVVLSITNGNDIQRPVTAVTARTQDLNNGIVKLNTFNVDAPSITDIEQAKNVASLFLKQKRFQDRVVKFRTALQGIYLRPGDLILVQHQITEYEFEVSGYVTALDAYDGTNMTQKIALSRQFPTPGAEVGYLMSFQLQSTGEVIENVAFTSVIEQGKPFIQLANGTLPATFSVGDPVVIGRTTTINRKYRVNSLSRGEDGTIEVSALIWDESMFDFSDLVIITE